MDVSSSTKIREKIPIKDFTDLIRSYGEKRIVCNQYALFRLTTRQQGKFTCETLKNYLLEDIPVLAGIQYNDRYTALYKTVFNPKVDEIEIITFYIDKKGRIPVVRE